MDDKLSEKILNVFVKQPLTVTAGAILGAFGLLNWLDSLIEVFQGAPWGLLDIMRPLFQLFREAARTVVGFLTELISLRLPGIWQDYVAMGLIVAGMRFRSTLVIQRAIQKDNKITEYKEDFFGKTFTVTGSSGFWSWTGFFTWRLVFAFILWPVKLVGASIRYLSGEVRNRGQGPYWDEIREKQYLAFFGSVVWAVLFIVLLLTVKAGLLILNVGGK